MLKCVMFDFGGTLMYFYDPETAARLYTKIFCKHGYKTSLGKMRVVRKVELKRHLEETYGDPTRHGKRNVVMKKTLEKLGFDVSNKEFEKMSGDYSAEMAKRYKLYPGALDVVSRLKKRGLKIAIVSNGSVSWVRKQLKRFGLEKYVDVLVVSDEIGYEKSSVVPFKVALKKLKLRPEECLMVGDRLDEDMHAKRLGIWTCHAAYGPSLPIVGLHFRPDFRIKSLRQLPKIVDNIIGYSGK